MGRTATIPYRALRGLGLQFRRPNHTPGGRWLPYRTRKPCLPEPFDAPTTMSEGGTLSVSIDAIAAAPGFSYCTEGWHPYVATLQQFQADPGLRYEDSALCRTFTRFQPETAQQALLEDIAHPIAPLDRLPPRVAGHEWVITRNEVRRALRKRPPAWMLHGKRVFGPVHPTVAVTEFEQLLTLYRSLRDQGLRPDLAPDPIRGYFLIRGDTYRFLLTGGQHRVAALRVLGETDVLVSLDWLGAVREDELFRWTEEAKGPYPYAVAQLLFDRLFTEDGGTKARNLGLIP